MIQFYKTLFQCSAAMSVISLVYMASMPLLSKRYTAKWRYYIWLVIVLGWIIPYRPQFTIPLFPAKTPAMHTVQFLPAKYITAVENLKALPVETAAAPSIDPGWLVFMIWFMGLVGILLYHTVRHVRFMKFVNRWSQDVVNLESINILDTLKSEMKIKTQVGLKTCTGIASPMMTGVYRNVIFLPSGNIPKDDLIFILRHELVHLRRNDLWFKAFVLLAAALHWFNPVVYIMAKAIARQCEISCDEEVLQGMNFEERRHYGEIIIGVVRNKVKLKTALSTNFCGGKKSMKTRIFSIMDTTKKKAGVIVLGIVFIATVGTGVVYAAGSANSESFINNSVDEQSEKNIIPGITRTRDVILVAVDSLESGEYICTGGPYVLSEGDIIQYDITAEGMGYLNAEFRKTSDLENVTGYLGHSGLTGNKIKCSNSFIVNESLAGSYYLWIGNYDSKEPGMNKDTKSLKNIEGTVKVAVETTGETKEQSISVPTTTGELNVERPPYSDMGKKSRQEYLSDLGFLDYDTDEHVYRYNGKWVRTINDRYTWNGKPYGGLSRSEAPEDYFSGEPVDLKVVRNQDTNQIEELVEMTESETQQALNADISIPSGKAASSQMP